MRKTPLTRKQSKELRANQECTVNRLKNLLKMPEAKDMLPEAEIIISGNLVLKNGRLYVFHRGQGHICPDYDTWDDDSYKNVSPTLELVEQFNVEISDIESIADRLRT